MFATAPCEATGGQAMLITADLALFIVVSHPVPVLLPPVIASLPFVFEGQGGVPKDYFLRLE